MHIVSKQLPRTVLQWCPCHPARPYCCPLAREQCVLALGELQSNQHHNVLCPHLHLPNFFNLLNLILPPVSTSCVTRAVASNRFLIGTTVRSMLAAGLSILLMNAVLGISFCLAPNCQLSLSKCAPGVGVMQIQ